MATISLKHFGSGALNLEIGDREFVVIAGPNEAELSAVIRGIAGLSDQSAGEILFDGKTINQVPSHERDVALLAHDYAPYPRLSIEDNLAIGLKQRRFGEAEIRKRVSAVADALRLQDRLGTSADSLQPAERPFVGLARAMVRQPRIYLFDRPFSHLAPTDANRGRAAIAELQQRASAGIVYATSDPEEALAFGTRTVIIDGGAIQQDADARTIYDFPANLAVARFGDPAMNLVQGTLKGDREVVTFVEAGEGTIALRLSGPQFSTAASELAGRSVTLGFRAEAIEIAPSQDGSKGPASSFRALVERSEIKGFRTDLYILTGAHKIVGQTAKWTAEEGRRLQFSVDLAKIHLFSENGRRIALSL